ncbi:hypothetical protein JW962_03825 [Candidatus Dojkabacteria bacterium]|nr:hypothetical protein [Candidatus Dojkabacteria bacterium]
MDILDKILTADTRRSLITWFIKNPGEKIHLRSISRIIKKQVNAVSRELANLLDIGFIKAEKAGRKKMFSANPQFPLYEEFLRLVYKTTGLGKSIIQNSTAIGNVQIAILTINYVNNTHKNQYDVDLLLVGEIHVPVASHLVKQVETEEKREIKYSVLTKDEFDFRRKKRDMFIERILDPKNIILIGGENL